MRGLYATDASIYQVQPLGVVVPRDAQDVEVSLAACREASVPVLPRGRRDLPVRSDRRPRRWWST